MSHTRRDVNPIIAVVAIILALAIVQFVYWRQLVGGPVQKTPAGGGGGRGAARGPERAPMEVEVSTLVGAPAPGHRDGPASEARFDGPAAVAVGQDGTVYIADSGNHCLRRLSPGGVVSTLAGAPGEAGLADGRGEDARFSSPAGLALLADGSILVADTGNHRLRRVSPAGEVVTMAGSETPRDGLGREVGGYRDGTARQAQLRFPVGLAVTRDGSVLVADAGNGCVRLVTADGRVSTVPLVEGKNLNAPTHLALAEDGNLWVSDSAGGSLWVGPPVGPLRPREGEASWLTSPAGLASLQEGKGFVVADSKAQCLWYAGGDGISVLAGSGAGGSPDWADGSGSEARFSRPAGVAVGPGGEIYVADYGNNCVRRVAIGSEREEDE
ncbi:MAG: hypothetical protein MUQ65_03025 [Armatimonadetes bacterium]|nr:hypothetical protein [Armatimonadota bacterium]